MARPSSFRDEYVAEAEKLCRLGSTLAEMAEFWGVAVSTVSKWIAENAAFSDAVKRGRQHADLHVADRLFRRATGYEHDAVKIFMPAGAQAPVYAPYIEHFPPDTTACIFWLKNRRPDLWREKTETAVSGDVSIVVQTGVTRDSGS